jgi:alcohol dehydrogenase class IV
MWYFRSPEIAFGEGALSRLESISGQRACIVTDAVLVQMGFVELVQAPLHAAGLTTTLFAEIEPEPSLETVQRGAEALRAFEPDWIIGLGGGSVLDAAKAMRALYERPDLEPAAINPFEPLGLHKTRLICIPTTSGTGADVTAGSVLTDVNAQRKLEVASFEMLAHISIVDPALTTHLPRQSTADTGLDVLSHAIEGYCNTWANDFSAGLCLQAARLVFEYLPRAVEQGAADVEAREKMANAATLAGLGMGNSHIALAHAMAHAYGALFPIPHGRITGLFLPYTVEFTAQSGVGRYLDLARIIGSNAVTEAEGARHLVAALRSLYQRLGQPTALSQIGLARSDFDSRLGELCDRAEMDVSLITALRVPNRTELTRLYLFAYDGTPIDF